MAAWSAVTQTVDADLDEAARRVAGALRHERQPVSRSLLLARAIDAFGSEQRARAALVDLEEQLRVWGAWTPPAPDRERVELTRKQRVDGYRESAVSTLVELRLRHQSMEHALHIASPIVVLALAVYFLFIQAWLVPALWVPFAILQLFLYLRRRERRERITVELDDRRLKAGDVEVLREDVRYVSAHGRSLEVALVDGSSRTLLPRVSVDDAVALAAILESELRLLVPRRVRRWDERPIDP